MFVFCCLARSPCTFPHTSSWRLLASQRTGSLQASTSPAQDAHTRKYKLFRIWVKLWVKQRKSTDWIWEGNEWIEKRSYLIIFSDRFFRSEKLLLSCFCFLLSFYGCFILKVTIWEPVTLSWGKWHSSLKLSIYFTSGSLPQMEETWLRRNFITIRTIWCVSACLQLFILGNDLRIIPAVPGSRPQIDNPGFLRRAGAVPGCGSLSFTFISDHPWTLTSRPELWDSLIAKSVVFIRPDCLQSPASPVNRLWDAPQVNVCPRQTNRLLKIVCRFPLLKRESWLHN